MMITLMMIMKMMITLTTNDDDDDDDQDDNHLLVEIDGAKTAHCGNDTEQVENPVQLHFGIPIRAL